MHIQQQKSHGRGLSPSGDSKHDYSVILVSAHQGIFTVVPLKSIHNRFMNAQQDKPNQHRSPGTMYSLPGVLRCCPEQKRRKWRTVVGKSTGSLDGITRHTFPSAQQRLVAWKGPQGSWTCLLSWEGPSAVLSTSDMPKD